MAALLLLSMMLGLAHSLLCPCHFECHVCAILQKQWQLLRFGLLSAFFSCALTLTAERRGSVRSCVCLSGRAASPVALNVKLTN